MNLNLQRRIALITGGSKGIGKAVARRLSAEGMSLSLCARNIKLLEETKAELVAESKKNILAVQADIESEEDIRRLVNRTLEEFGRIDVLVNNAGPGAIAGSFLSLSDEAWRQASNLRIVGYVRMIREVVPTMINQGKGRIINIAGVAGKEPDSLRTMMGVVTAGVFNLTRGLSQAFTAQGVTVVGVAPGRTFTDHYPTTIRRLAAEQGVNEEEVKRSIISHIPIGRFVQPEEIANTVAFLASDLAEAINGTTVVVDGGEMHGF